MSFAPASSRGAFLKARLAVNGIQCAARSFGTLTAGAFGLLSSMGASSSVSGEWELIRKLSASKHDWNANNLRSFGCLRRIVARASTQVAGRDKKYLGFRILGVEPEQRQLWISGLDVLAA